MDQDTVHNKQASKRRYIVAGLVIFMLGAILISINLLNEGEPEQSANLQQSEESKQVASSMGFRMFDNRTVEITKYEMFYRNSTFYSKEAVEFYSLIETIQKYALFHHLERHGYTWDDEKRDMYKERSKGEVDYDMKDANLKAYYEKMFDALQITEEEYIEYYLLVNREYEALEHDLYKKAIGLDRIGAYPSGDAEMTYMNLMGITEDKLNELAEKIPEPPAPIEPQPNLPFITEDFWLKVTTNDEGEYIFVDANPFLMYVGDPYTDLLYELKRDVVKEELTRNSLKRYQDAVASYESDDAQKMKVIKELGLILEILEQSIEMELM